MLVVDYENPTQEMQTVLATDKTTQRLSLKCHLHFDYGKRQGKGVHGEGKISSFLCLNITALSL